MKFPLTVAIFAFHASVVASKSGVTPVQKVIQLMQGMLAKGKKEKHDEQVQFAAYKQFCDDTSVEKKRLIKEAELTLEKLEADIAQYTADAKQLTKEINGHDDDISAWTGDKNAATKVRSMEKADYDALHKDFSESVDALGRAIEVVKAKAEDRAQASLVQISALRDDKNIPQQAKTALDIFLQEGSRDPLDVTAPEAYGYEFQAHGIVEMLEKLLDKFIAERTALEKKEMNTKHSFELLIQDLEANLAQAKADRTLKSETKAKKLQARADAQGDHEDTKGTKEADEQYLADLTATCEQKASDFESRQALRAEELTTINKAIEIMSSEAVSGNADKYLPALVQTSGPSLAQLRSSGGEGASQRSAAQYLMDRARAIDSRILSAAATKMVDDPFAKVKKMIKDLIVRLMEEANEEAEHKGWCDTELSTNEQTRKEKTESVETLHAEIDELETSISKLTEDIDDLTKAVAALQAEMLKMTTLRQEEKAKNLQTIEDATEAQTAVAQAMIVLKEFYTKAGEATALLQQEPPPIFDSPYKGMQSEHGGVVGMLEVIASDFARLEADTKAAEASAQKEYDTFMTESKVDKAAKETDIEHKTTKKQDHTQSLSTKKDDLEGTQKELDAALAYFDKLKPSCVDAGVSYDGRVARRQEEIESLQEALRILNGEDIAS